MNVENLFGSMIEGALLGGGKRSHGAQRFLRGGRGSFLNASTLLTVGGLVWGAIETMQQQQRSQATSDPSPTPMGAPPAGSAWPTGASPSAAPSLSVPPPLPGSAGLAGAPPTAPAPDAIPEGAQRVVRLMVSAARADGTLTESEREVILQHAREAGAERLVADEIARPTLLARIVEGVADEQQRRDLYVLAYSIVRADESVSGSEQIYLAQLAALLGLDRPAVAALEGDVAARIAEAGHEG